MNTLLRVGMYDQMFFSMQTKFIDKKTKKKKLNYMF